MSNINNLSISEIEKILANMDGWQYRRCLNKADTTVPYYPEFVRTTAMEKSGDNFKYNGIYLSTLERYWTYVKGKYGHFGLPDKIEDHKDLDGNALKMYTL